MPTPIARRPEPALSAALRGIPAPKVKAHPVEFTGSGGEYFKVWIVNVLLSVVTLGIYTPRARLRTAQYFYGHTQVVGSPLEFVANARKMLFGFLAFTALYGGAKVAQRSGQDLAASLIFFGFALLAPYLWASAMRFRLGATRWRGIRLMFAASWKEVYLASWPVFAMAAIWTVAFAGVSTLVPSMLESLKAQTKDKAQTASDTAAAASVWAGHEGTVLAIVAGAVVLTLLCLIRLEYNYKRLLFARARIGEHVGRWKPVYSDFVKVWLATVGMLLLCTVLGGALLMGLFAGGAGIAMLMGKDAGIGAMILLGLIGFVLMLMAMVLISLPARAYREARMFQLVWNNVGFGGVARTKTSLRTGPYVWLRAKNVFLSYLTLGFYRPYAVASEYQAKFSSITIYIKGGVDQLEGDLVRQQGAFGDAAADAFGLDLIG